MSTPDDWTIQYLSDVVQIQRGFDLPHHARRPGPYPVLTSGESGGFHAEGPVKGPGVTIGRATNLGKPKWSDGDFWPHNTTMFVKDFKGNHPRWVFHLFENTDLAGYDSGSVQPMLNRNYIAKVPVLVPPHRDQQGIAEVLGALDGKIAANAALAQSAHALAGAIFTRASMSADVAAVPLGSFATLVLGGTPSRTNEAYWRNGTVPWLNSGKANEQRVISPSELITEEALAKSAAKMMPIGATVLAITGATLGQVARLEIEACGNQSLVGIWGSSAAHTDWIHFAVRAAMPELLKSATGAAQQHVNKQAVASLPIMISSDETVAKFGAAVRPLLSRATQADRESQFLSQTRDVLLSRLMSGKIRVKDAERVVEGAV